MKTDLQIVYFFASWEFSSKLESNSKTLSHSFDSTVLSDPTLPTLPIPQLPNLPMSHLHKVPQILVLKS